MPENSSRFKIIERYRITRKAPGTIRLWSLQPLAIWQELQHSEKLWVKPESTDKDFQSAYRWMTQQMQERITGYQGHYPWWAYPFQKPDLRCWNGHFFGDKGVRLELQLASEKVLISDYETWHCVLNSCALPLSPNDEAEEEISPPPGMHLLDCPFPTPAQRKAIESWARIFDLGSLSANGWAANSLQACFEELNLKDVITVEILDIR